MLLSFWLGLCSFIIIVQILLWTWLLYNWVSYILLWLLWFMIIYERKTLWKRWDIIADIFSNRRSGITSGKMWYIVLFVLLILSLIYYYYGLQNSFVPYSTAWDANHEYMYIPKILAENHWIYRGNTVWNSMPWFWHQFITFVFSFAWNWWLWLSPDNMAISMNNLSAWFVLVFWIAVIFQIFNLLSKKEEKDIVEEKKWKKNIIEIKDLEHWTWIAIGWSLLLLWLTSGMWAFLVIVDNKTDLWVMAFSLLALLAWLIFLQNKRDQIEKKELLKYIIIAGLLFWIAAIAKVTAFVDLTLFWLLLIALWFSPITSLWVGVFVMWVVRKFNVLTSATILSESQWLWLMIIWAIITITGLGLYLSKSSKRKSFWENFKQLLILWISFIIPMLVCKLSWTSLSQIKTDSYSITNSLKSTFLAFNDTKEESKNKLLAQANEEILDTQELDINTPNLNNQNLIDSVALNSKPSKSFEQCKSLTGNKAYSEDELSKDLQEAIWDGWAEDFWRYIWYWWEDFSKSSWDWDKRYNKNWVFWILALLWPGNKDWSLVCYSTNHDAKVLCENSSVIDQFKIDDLRAIYGNGIKDKESEVGLLLKDAIDAYDLAKKEWKINFKTDLSWIFHDEIVALRQYYQSHNIASTYNKTDDSGAIYIPYRLLIPLNISFNWSLQNLSSYYTDLWFFWVIVYFLLLISLPYAIIKKDRILTALSLTTLLWWWIRWIIWSAILWYWTVLISWSMITLAVFFADLSKKINNSKEETPTIIFGLLLWLLGLIFLIQISLNFCRISSQWANSVFVWYKWNIWQVQEIDENLQASTKIKSYKWKDVFDMQFPQYNPIINALASRDDNDWVIVAWTYIQYFLWNQWNIKSDWMLTNFWVNTSDGDLCKTYWRLKNDNTRYLIIDPNIGTVTMWEWNESLFYRFFAKISPDWKEIDTDGTITTLIRLASAGYLKLLSTNNLWAKYAFTLDDETIRQYFGENLSDEELILTRSKMAVLQYFDDANEIFSNIVYMFGNRIMYEFEWAIEDIANVYGMEVDSRKIAIVADNIMGGYNSWIGDLSQDERIVLINFLNIYSDFASGDSNSAWSMIQNLLMSSVTGWSQVIALELNE